MGTTRSENASASRTATVFAWELVALPGLAPGQVPAASVSGEKCGPTRKWILGRAKLANVSAYR
jgi:hypothetical protein